MLWVVMALRNYIVVLKKIYGTPVKDGKADNSGPLWKVWGPCGGT